MKARVGAVAIAAAMLASEASAQGVDLTGRYRCIELCAPELQGQFAFITQNGTELNLVNDAGERRGAWIDYPGDTGVERASQAAIHSADGRTIQFARGTVWQRVPAVPPPPPPRTRR